MPQHTTPRVTINDAEWDRIETAHLALAKHRSDSGDPLCGTIESVIAHRLFSDEAIDRAAAASWPLRIELTDEHSRAGVERQLTWEQMLTAAQAFPGGWQDRHVTAHRAATAAALATVAG